MARAEFRFEAVLPALVDATDQRFWRLRLAKLAEEDGVLHVAVMREPFLSLLLDGTKTVESRFSVNRIPPYNQVEVGDVLVLKEASGPLSGLALVKAVHYFELDENVLGELRAKYALQIAATEDSFWRERANKNYATLIEVANPARISQVDVAKRDRRGWAPLVPTG